MDADDINFLHNVPQQGAKKQTVRTKLLLGGLIGANATVFSLWRAAKQVDTQFMSHYIPKGHIEDIANFSVNITPRLLYDSPNLTKTEIDLGNFLFKHFCFSVKTVTSGKWWTILTHSVSHVNFLHFICNMESLWTFGKELGKIVGPIHTGGIYLYGVIGGTIAHMIVNRHSHFSLIGASGAVAALMTALYVIRPSVYSKNVRVQATAILYPLVHLYLHFFTSFSGVSLPALVGGALAGVMGGYTLKELLHQKRKL